MSSTSSNTVRHTFPTGYASRIARNNSASAPTASSPVVNGFATDLRDGDDALPDDN